MREYVELHDHFFFGKIRASIKWPLRAHKEHQGLENEGNVLQLCRLFSK